MVGIAVVGYGYWGPNLARNFAETEGAAVVMCCDSDQYVSSRDCALEATRTQGSFSLFQGVVT